MGTFIHHIGTLSIPPEKMTAFLTDAAVVADQGGLMAQNIIYVFGRQIVLLSFPDFSNSDEQYIDFDYSYFENDTWENAGIYRKNGTPYSGKIGWKHFNKAVQALYILAELYSDTPYATMNDSCRLQAETIQWLRYILERELHYTWRSQIWELVEIEARKQAEHSNEPTVDFSFITEYGGDETDPYELVTAASVLMAQKDFINPETREAAQQGEEGIITFDQAMIKYYDGVVAFRETSVLSEEDQIEFLFRFLKGFDGRKEEDRELLYQYANIAVSSVVLPSQTCVKIIADAYGRNFWKLWWAIKDHLCKQKAPLKYTVQKELAYQEMSTKEFFRVSDEDRLYWWRKDGDIELTEEIQSWLKRMQERYSELWKQPIPGETGEWQRRFVSLLSRHPDVECFELLFFEFMGNFNSVMFRAAVLLLEEIAGEQAEYRRLIAVMANQKLRYGVFFF